MSIEIPVKVNGEWKNATPYVKVNGSWVELSEAYVKKDDTWVALHSAAPAPEDCMYLTSASGFTVAFSTTPANMYYSLNGGSWTKYTAIIAVPAGQKVYFWNKDTSLSSSSTRYTFEFTAGGMSAAGDIMSLRNFNALNGETFCFADLFKGCTGLVSASGLVFPSEVSPECYYRMFYGCTTLTSAPALPATSLGTGIECYYNMFYGCSALTTAPALPATTLAMSCYEGMFKRCSSLTTAPALPATTLAASCYKSMFERCSLISAPELPATTLATSCYEMMFCDCPSLMISDSTGISFFTCPSTIPTNAVAYMFTGTGGSYTDDPVAGGSYYYVGPLCFTAREDYVSILFEVEGTVDTTGLQYSYDNTTWTTITDIRYPITIENTGDKIYIRNTNDALSTSTSNYLHMSISGGVYVSGNVNSMIDYSSLSSYCFYRLFCGSGSSSADFSNMVLPATTLADHCYQEMFCDCTTGPLVPPASLPATTLAVGCYQGMFMQNMSHLTATPMLGNTNTMTLAADCCKKMFSECFSLMISTNTSGTKFFTMPSTIPSGAVTDMFYNTGGAYTEDPVASGVYYYIEPDPLCFTANTAGSTVGYTLYGTTYAFSMKYSTDGTSWSYWDGTAITLASVGDKLYVKNGDSTLSSSSSNYFQFVITGSVAASGNVDSMINYRELSSYCYYNLFSSCSGLTTPPKLPATTLASGCYRGMFNYCTSLTSAPALPATTMASYCYAEMFLNCSSLTTAPALPATTLASYCYYWMFKDCSLLTTPPALLPATTLSDHCYQEMFTYCNHLTSAPALPATTLAEHCYESMFLLCEALYISDSTGTSFFTCPSTIPTGAVMNMFLMTSGTYTNDPVAGGTYYYYT